MAYTIGVFEGSNNMVFVNNNIPRKRILKGDGKGRPASQFLRYGSSVCAEKLDIETAWGGKNDLSPSSADMHKPNPCPFPWLETMHKPSPFPFP